MIEIIIREYLEPILGVSVTCERLERPPEKYVLIERTGETKTNHIRHATVAIRSHAPTMFEAAAMNEEILAAMDEIVKLNEIGGITLNSDYNYTDTDTKGYRYQAVYNITYYGRNKHEHC